MRKTLTAAAVALITAGYWSAPVVAANIVANPGFEANVLPTDGSTTPPTSWTVTAINVPSVGLVGDAGVEEGFSNSGSNAAYIGYGILSQALSTVAGTTYTVSFFVGIDDLTTFRDANATFDATVSGTTLGTVDLLGGTPLTPSGVGVPVSWVQCPDPSNACGAETTDTFTAQDSSTTISFTGITSLSGSSPTGVWYLDDVSVTPVPAPEPSDLLVLATALGLLTLARTRRA